MPDGVTSMAYNEQNGPPWHGKGVALHGLATAAECIKAAGLDWAVTKVPLRLSDDGAVPLSNVMATVRADLSTTDQRRVLGIVGEEYQPLQNWDAFRFFDCVVDAKEAIYETAGSIENGKRIWLLAKLPHKMHVGPDDEIIPYMLLANGHDGQLMVHVKFTPVRVVCQNTLAMALYHQRGPHIAVRHDRYLKRKLEDAAEIVATVRNTLTAAADTWNSMARCRLAVKDAERYFRSVFGGTERESPDEQDVELFESGEAPPPSARLAGLKKEAMDNFESKQARAHGITGTLWAAYNGAVWAIDFARKNHRDRVDDLCLAEGAMLKERALKFARDYIGRSTGA